MESSPSLTSLRVTEPPATAVTTTTVETKSGWSGAGLLNLLIWFIVIAIIVYLLLFAFKPNIVRKVGPNGQPTNEVDQGRLILASVIISLIIVVIIFLLRLLIK